MSRTAITRGSLYHGSIILAIIHFCISLFFLLLGIYIMTDYSIEQVEACLFLVWTAVGLLAATLMIAGLFFRSSVLSFLAFILVVIEALGLIVIFGLYFFEVLDKSKSLMVGDQNFAQPICFIQIFLTLYFCFAYSRVFRYLYPVEDENKA